MQNRIASIHDVFSATFVVPRAVELIHLSLSAQRLPKPATIDLIEVRRLVYSSRNPKRACWHQPRWLGGQVCQDLDIGDGIGKREPISAPHLQRPKHFQLFAIGLRKIELTLTDPDVRSEEHTSELQSRLHLVCRLLLEKKKTNGTYSEDPVQDTSRCTIP